MENMLENAKKTIIKYLENSHSVLFQVRLMRNSLDGENVRECSENDHQVFTK